jgi:ADP-L-glycero-D-manno-heptose 6-epimerase
LRCVVTGGAGFIGSAICSVLEARSIGSITVVDELRGEQWMNIAKRSLHSIIAPRDLWSYLDSCPEDTAIIHMGGRTSTTDNDTGAVTETNIRLAADLFDYCADRRWPFIYASSAAVYGTSGDQSDDHARLATLQPLNAYAWSKLMADRMIVERSAAKSPPFWAGLRFFNVYGPAEEHKGDQRSFVSKCFDGIRTGQAITLFRGSENYRRDWVFVGDVARLVADLLTTQPQNWSAPKAGTGGIYNVGSGEAVSFTDVASICIEASGKIAPVSTVAFPDELRGRYQVHTRADTAKLKALMPNFHFNDLRQGALLAWQFAQRDGLSRFP